MRQNENSPSKLHRRVDITCPTSRSSAAHQRWAELQLRPRALPRVALLPLLQFPQPEQTLLTRALAAGSPLSALPCSTSPSWSPPRQPFPASPAHSRPGSSYSALRSSPRTSTASLHHAPPPPQVRCHCLCSETLLCSPVTHSVKGPGTGALGSELLAPVTPITHILLCLSPPLPS